MIIEWLDRKLKEFVLWLDRPKKRTYSETPFKPQNYTGDFETVKTTPILRAKTVKKVKKRKRVKPRTARTE